MLADHDLDRPSLVWESAAHSPVEEDKLLTEWRHVSTKPWARLRAFSSQVRWPALRGEATSPLYALLPLAFSRDRLSLLHGFLIYLASSLSPPATGLPVWSLALFLAAGLLLGAGSRYALAAATAGLALRLAAGVQSGDLWSWSSLDIALAALWVLAWVVRHLGDAPRMWGAYGALSLFFEGAGGVFAVVASVALALWKFKR